jgi:hypothetical protein
MAGYGYAYGWGLAYPDPGYRSVVLIPRPPRPGVVNLAVILTYLGVGLSLVEAVAGIISLYIDRGSITSQVNDGIQSDPSAAAGMAAFAHAAFGLMLVVAIVTWVLPATGAVVTALLTGRGANPARIVLASLMGVYALSNLCGGTFGLVNLGGKGEAVRNLSILGGLLDVVLGALAVTIGVLVLVPSANRYFSAGPGRRFAPSN